MWALEESEFLRDVADFALAHKLPNEVETMKLQRFAHPSYWAPYA
jgi:hypothetical protein